MQRPYRWKNIFGTRTSKIKKVHLLSGGTLRLGTHWSPRRAKHSGRSQPTQVLVLVPVMVSSFLDLSFPALKWDRDPSCSPMVRIRSTVNLSLPPDGPSSCVGANPPLLRTRARVGVRSCDPGLATGRHSGLEVVPSAAAGPQHMREGKCYERQKAALPRPPPAPSALQR